MTSRVRAIRLEVRLPAAHAHEQDRLRDELERALVVSVLERAEARLHATLGVDAVVCLRHIALRWELARDEVADADVIARLAAAFSDEILTAIGELPPEERRRPSGATVAYFATASYQRAVALADHADGLGARWYHGEEADAATHWQRVRAAEPAVAAEVVTALIRIERLEPALALADDAVLAVIAEAVPSAQPTIARIVARREVARAQTTPAPTTAAAVPMASTAAPAPPVDAAHAAASESPPRDHATTAPPTLETPLPSEARDRLTAAPPAPPIVAAVAPTPPSDARDRTTATTATAASATDGERAPAPTPSPPTEAAPLASEPAPPPDEPAPSLTASTAWAGLFYLMRDVLDLGLAEALWSAGLVEGDVLSAVGRALIADPDDPAAPWFGGAFATPPRPFALAPWQLDELRAAAQHALGRWLVGHGRVTTPAALEDELAGLVAALGPSALAPTAAALVHHLAAVLASATCARVHQPPAWPTLRAILARPGRMVVDRTSLIVIMNATAVDLDHRRTGLDRNPGHVPWLGRTVRFEFVGGEVW